MEKFEVNQFNYPIPLDTVYGSLWNPSIEGQFTGKILASGS